MQKRRGSRLKFSVGYNCSCDTGFLEDIIKNKEHIEEIYFSWGSFPNGRAPQTESGEMTEWEAYEKMNKDLARLNEEEIKFNLLFNGNCYGRESLCESFYNEIGDCTDYIKCRFNLASVTTTSPLIAKFIKDNFSDIRTRASVNMGIGSCRGMDYAGRYFDGYYLKREYNRDFEKINELKKWCGDNGKELYILANSGCLSDCSAHTFHDNLVAHEKEISKMKNGYSFEGICHEYLKNKENYISLLKDTSFIRPEEVHLYEPYFNAMKLATRATDMARMVLKSYISGRHSGNVLELLEPNHSGRLYPYVIDNRKLTDRRIFCSKKCSECKVCADELKAALTNLSEGKEILC